MDFEKLGAFFLGHQSGPGTSPEPLVYDAKDLTTHALCVGMTGSGKTGLCISLLEEAAIDGIPAIALDLKGDLANLMLTFPELRPEDFAPWIDAGEAARAGHTVDEHASAVAERWRRGLTESGQSPERIARMRANAEFAIFTPGSASGRPLSVLREWSAPPAAVASDADLLRERIATTVSSVLALLGIEGDPLQSREHILLSQLFLHAWAAGRSLDIGQLIRNILEPPIDRVGVMDLESFFDKKDRAALAMRLNNLLAAPSFAAWMEGEPLSVERLLWTPEGKPRLSIVSLAQLSDSERMFFVTLLLGEVLAWMRTQPGTASLRAILYMDEVFGFFPPVKNPPSKTPMLTLLKQARAFGLGVVLATQNPVDLDYKGLSNCGTWWLGRLQTQRDIDRVLDGLEGAASASSGWSRAETEKLLAGLEGRQFLMNDVHREGPVLFKTRWALSYLRGPLTRDQVRKLTEEGAPDAASTGVAQLLEPATAPLPPVASPTAAGAGASQAAASPSAASPAAATPNANTRPVLTGDIEELFVVGDAPAPTYRAAVLASVAIHYQHRHAELDVWLEPSLLVALPSGRSAVAWGDATWHRAADLRLASSPAEGARFLPHGRSDLDDKGFAALKKSLSDHLYKSESMPVFYCRALSLWSRYGESRSQLAARAQLALREARDRDIEKLRAKYAPKLEALGERVRKAEQRVARESAQQSYQGFDTAVSVGATVVGALFGGRSVLSGTRSAMRGAGRLARERGDVGRAEDDVRAEQDKLARLEQEFEADAQALRDQPLDATIEDKSVKPNKGDIAVTRFALVWLP